MIKPILSKKRWASVLAAAAFLLGLWACNLSDAPAKTFMAIKIDSTWMGYDSIWVVINDAGGTPKDTVFHHKVTDVNDLKEVPVDDYHGEKVVVEIIGFKGGKAARREFRLYDGTSTTATDTQPIAEGGNKSLTVQPKNLRLYTGGETGRLKAYPLADWQGKSVSWTALENGIVMVSSQGLVTPIAVGTAHVVVSAENFNDTAVVQVVRDAPKVDAGLDTLVALHASVIFRVRATQEYGYVKAFSWDLDGDGNWDGSLADFPASQTVTSALLSAPARTFDTAGDYIVGFRVIDGEGNEVGATRKVKVADKVPRIDSLSKDLVISIGDRASFEALASESDGGTLRGFSWDYDGDGATDDTSSLTSAPARISGSHVYLDSGTFTVNLRVTDGAGLTAKGAIHVKVKLDRPSADAGSDTTVQAGTAVNLHGKDTDSMGVIVKREWKIGDGQYQAVPKGDLTFTAPAAAGPLICLYRVTDDDNLQSEDAVTVTVTTSAPTGKLTALALSDGSLVPAFDPSVYDYAASVSNTVASVTLAPSAASGDTVRVEGNVVADGSSSAPVPLAVGPTVIHVEVTAKGGTPKTAYAVTVTRAASAGSDLASLSLSAGALSPTFTPSRTLYEDSVANSVSNITVTPASADPGATIKVEGAAVASGSASSAIDLPVGSKQITIEVTSQDKSTTTSYKVTVKRAGSSDAYLSALAVSSGSLSPAFASDHLVYTASVGNAVTGIKVTPTADDAAASIKVENTVVASGSASGNIALPVGPKDIAIEVTAQDGSVKNYKITVTRAASGNADLSDLALSSGSLAPAFAAGQLNYSASVANSVSSIKVTPTAADPGATITVENAPVASGAASASIALPVGSKSILIDVTAPDGTVKSYKVTVSRAGSGNTNLSALALSAGSPSPAFAAGTTAYTLSVPNGTASTTVTPTAEDPASTITVDGAAVASGTASGSIALPIGGKTINIDVTAQDASTKRYTVTVTRAGSSNANLSGLSLSAGSISPAFSAGTTAYTLSVANGVTGTTVTPTVADGNASVTVENVAVASGTASGNISLPVGPKDINVAVTAQDGSVKTYKVTVTRAGSSNADLSSLSVSVGGINFSSGTTSYNLSVGTGVSSTTITPTAAGTGASLRLIYSSTNVAIGSGNTSGSIPLAVGANAISVQVTAQDGITIKTYTVNITRAAPPNADLSGLVPGSGSLSPSFSSSTLNYTVTVSNSVVNFWLTPTAAAAGSAIIVNPGSHAVSSGQSSPATSLAVGNNSWSVQVTSQDGTVTKTYNITVTRQQAPLRLAYFVNDVPGSSSTPSGSTAFNSSGGGISIVRGGTGLYNVTFTGLSNGTTVNGAPLVTAMGTTAAYCKSTGMSSSGSNLVTIVNCFDYNGNALDTKFSFALMMPHPGANAYAEMYIGSSATYSPFQMYNSTGGSASARKADRFSTTPGMYNVTFGGLYSALGGPDGIMVSGLDQTTTGCMVGSFGTSVSGNWDAEVYCAPPGFASGTAFGNFTIAVTGPVPAGGSMDLAYALVFGNATTTNASNSAGGNISVTHPSTGVYDVTFPGLGAVQPSRGGNIQVSRFNFSALCYVNSWSGSPNLTAEVRCTSNGQPADDNFSIWAIK